ncbi:unnamed protein product [Paramecium primaurelia]|uniref:Uncharacterized protein n=1 Tax=Paramecium primaurelia TaxID=5886 RepID=A0A8S1P498_PARPR|nr:unnamed protein product [Paramecium primaurelia]
MLKFLQELFFSIQEVDIKFGLIKFVSLDQLTLKYFSYELMKQLDELKIPYLNCDINNFLIFSKMEKILNKRSIF